MGVKSFLIERLAEKAFGGIIYTDRVTIDFRHSTKEQIAKAFSISELEAALIYVNGKTKKSTNLKKKARSGYNENELIFQVSNMLMHSKTAQIKSFLVRDYKEAFNKEELNHILRLGELPSQYLAKLSSVAVKRLKIERDELGLSKRIKLTKQIFQLASEMNVKEINDPIVIRFEKDHVQNIANDNDLSRLQEVFKVVERMDKTRQEGKIHIANPIFNIAREKMLNRFWTL